MVYEEMIAVRGTMQRWPLLWVGGGGGGGGGGRGGFKLMDASASFNKNIRYVLLLYEGLHRLICVFKEL